MAIEHVTITDPNVHEPKGASTATTDTAYISDGAGSGTWKHPLAGHAAASDGQVFTKTDGWLYLPTGWGFYDDNGASQVINTTPSKLSIDGTGANTEESYLPKEIRGSGSLWDTVNDKITPINIGDSYTVRLDLSVSATTGSPNYILLELDISLSGSPTTVVVTRPISVYKTAPFLLSVGFPIFCLSTFKTNGGQIFLSTDVGTVTIDDSAILIARISSGDY